jgi:hypothetical protein
MTELQVLEEKLQQIRTLLDEVGTGLAASNISCRLADIERVGKALSAITDIQLSIYEQQPSLSPEYLTDSQIYRNANQQFSRILIQNEHYLSNNMPNNAIMLLNEFIGSQPPNKYAVMANNEIARIKGVFNV